MAGSNELRPVSYRIDDETKDKIKLIADELQLSQQGTLQKLIEAFELQKDKSLVSDPGKKEIIENFEFYTSKLNQSFISIVQGLQDADEKAEMKVLDKLQSKDMTIQDLQEKITTANQLKEAATLQAKEFANKNLQLEKDIQELNKQIEAMNKQIDTYKASNEALTASLTLANEKAKDNEEAAKDYSMAVKELDKVKNELEKSKNELELLKHDHAAELKQLDTQKQLDIRAAVETAKEEAQQKIDVLKSDYEARIAKINDEMSKRVDNYQEKLEKASERTDIVREKLQGEIERYKKMYEEVYNNVIMSTGKNQEQ